MALGGMKIRVNGAEVTAFLKQGERELVLADLPWEAAEKIGLAFLEAAKRAEEYAKAHEIIQDQAVLFRSGAPFAISNNEAIRAEALKEAVWNRDLRRSNLHLVEPAGGIASQEQVGVPTITQTPPTIVVK